jgi:hypothetical protein
VARLPSAAAAELDGGPGSGPASTTPYSGISRQIEHRETDAEGCARRDDDITRRVATQRSWSAANQGCMTGSVRARALRSGLPEQPPKR